MDIRVETLKRGLEYLDNHTFGEGVILAVLAAVAPPQEIGKEAKGVVSARRRNTSRLLELETP